MPRGDRTGPIGMGSGTGRGMGYCSGAQAPGFASAPGRGGFRQGGFGRGCGRGGRFGRAGGNGWGRGQMFAGPFAGENMDMPQAQRHSLRQQVEAMEASLAALKSRLANLEDASSED